MTANFLVQIRYFLNNFEEGSQSFEEKSQSFSSQQETNDFVSSFRSNPKIEIVHIQIFKSVKVLGSTSWQVIYDSAQK